ncbi:MAG: GNAT family N-acetyltransferase [Bacteroidales bacterium]|nr:GNAT family N-acetyltransferase [Bacteroidales bacterium]
MISLSNTIQLRAPELSDLERIFIWENDSELWHLSHTLLPFSAFAIEQYILNEQADIYEKKQARFMLSLQNKEGKEIDTVGAIDLFDFDAKNRRAGVGILVDKKSRKMGYASLALEKLIDYSFNILNLHQLYCSILSENEESLKLFKKHQFMEVGIKKEWVLLNNRWQDEYLLQLINKKSI